MTGDEVRTVDIISGLDGRFSEAEVGNGYAAGLFRVVSKITLGVEVGVVADDFNGVLVCSDGAVGAETPEHAARVSGGCGVRAFLDFKGKVGHVVVDANGESAFSVLFGVAVNCNYLCRGGVLAAKTVAPAENCCALEFRSANGGGNIKIKRFANSAGLLSAVKNGDCLDGIRDNVNEMLYAERTVETDFYKSVFFACGVEVVDGLLDGVANGAHSYNNVLGVRSAVVVEELIIGADFGVDFVHIFLNNFGKCVIELVAGFSCLEENIRVLGGTAGDRVVGVKGVFAESVNGVEISESLELFVVPNLNFLNLMGGSEAVEKMYERNSSFDCGKVGDRGKVHYLLRVAGAKHGKARLAAGVDVRMVAENAERVGSESPCGNVDDSGKELAGNFIHIRDHKKKSLGSGKRSGKGAGGKRAVDGTGSAGFGLHLRNLDLVAENIGSSACGPLVRKFSHNRGGRYRIDCGYVGVRVGNVSGGGVAVHCFF